MDRISVRRMVDKMMVKEGSLWRSTDDKRFRVIHVVEQDGHTWVHYRDETRGPFVKDTLEYSCYIESFIQRFTRTPE